MKIDQALGSLRLDGMAISDNQSSDVVPLRSGHRPWVRLLAFWGPIGAATLAGTWLAWASMADVVLGMRVPVTGLLAFVLFYSALTGMPMLLGVVVHLLGRGLRADAQPGGLSRTALVMPIHQEDPAAVVAAIEAMARAVAEAGLARVDFFVLSDTQDMALAADERAAFEAAQARLTRALGQSMPGFHYRRRSANAGRKAGNLAEFCETWGDAYDYMVVLDADSLMGVGAIARLIGLMDAHPRTGIIQTVPYAVGRETVFARLQQFTARLYTPLLVEGLTFWQGDDGNYWGHNAIVRVAPFRAHCTLPVLPGREPWGGEILCHDVVEAGLMRGAGWHVWVLPEVMDSYEAVPVNMVDFVVRERRWCQGNLQHSRVMRLPGFRGVGRFHMAYGILHYMAAPATLLLLGLLTADAAFGGGAARLLLGSAALVGLMAGLLYGGKALVLLLALVDEKEARGFGGRLGLLGSAVLEQLAAFVLTATMIVSYTRFVVDLVRGRTVRWDAQARGDRGVGWAEAWLRMRGSVLIGVVWLAALPFLPGAVAAWTLPLLLGLLLSWPFAVLTSRTDIGAVARRMRLFLTPEEMAPPAVLRACQRLQMLNQVPAAPAGVPAMRHLVPREDQP